MAIQVVLTPAEAGDAPIAALLTAMTGDAGARVVGLIGLLMVLANFSSGVWAASRLIFSSAREGLLPASISIVHTPSGTPRRAVIVAVLAFIPALFAWYAGLISHADLFRPAGVGFFSLYALSVLAYLRLTRAFAARVFGLETLLLVLATLSTFGAILILPLILFGAGWLWQR